MAINAFISSKADAIGGGTVTGLDQAQVDARIRTLTSTVAREVNEITTDAPPIRTNQTSVSTNFIGQVIPDADKATDQYILGTPDALLNAGAVLGGATTYSIPLYENA